MGLLSEDRGGEGRMLGRSICENVPLTRGGRDGVRPPATPREGADRVEAARRGCLVTSVLDRISRVRSRAPWIGPFVALLVVYAIFAIATPESFLRTQVALAMARQTVIVAICALGMTMVIIT